MKAVFGTNIKSPESKPDGLALITRRPGEAAYSQYTKAAQQLEAERSKGRVSPWMLYLQYFAYLISVFLFYNLLHAGLSSPELYDRLRFLFPLAIVCSIAAIMLSVITWRKKKTAKESEAYLMAARETQGAIRQVYASMELPQDAVPMDVFYYGYKAKKDKLVPYAKGFSMYVYDNKVVRVYRQADTLCIADKEGVIPVSLQEISSIKTIKRTVALPHWNKTVSFQLDPYKQFRISQNSYGFYSIPRYQRMTFLKNGEMWELLFPNYELPIMEKLTGMRADQK